MRRVFDRPIWIPQLVAATTNPSLGNGTAWGHYTIGGSGLVTATFYIAGGAGASSGSGAYTIVAPVPGITPGEFYTIGSARTNGATNRMLICNMSNTGAGWNMQYILSSSDLSINAVNSGSTGHPMANGRSYRGTVTYFAA